MCIITSTVNNVSKTRIYVSGDGRNRRQITVYSNSVNSPDSNAMVLPVPNPDTIELLDFSHYKDFFEDLKSCFHDPSYMMRSASLGFGHNAGTLPVYSVGSYDVTIVPSLEEFDRIDFKRFKVDKDLYSFLTRHYNKDNFGFLICDLKRGEKNYHPFAYTHHQHKSGRLFIPTMHYHPHEYGFDHRTHDADWDHLIYSPSTSLYSSEYRFRTNTPVKWEKLPMDYRWAKDTSLDCWKKVGLWENRDLFVSHTVDPRGIADDCVTQ